MAIYDGTEPFKDNPVVGNKLDSIAVWHGIALPVGAANKVPQYGLFLLVDDLDTPTTRTWYIQTSATISSPSFVEIPTGNEVLGSELGSTPITDTVENDLTLNIFFHYFTLPTDAEYYSISAIEWKNGTAVAGNVNAAVYLVQDDPPSHVGIRMVSSIAETAQAGTSAVQKVNTSWSEKIPGGSILGIAIESSNISGKFRKTTGAASANTIKLHTYAKFPIIDTTAWSATTNRTYLKAYYKPWE